MNIDDWSKDSSLEQGSDAWKAARTRRIGGSDIAVIMGVSPYRTRRELWAEKTGRVKERDIANLPHVKRGVDAEPIARALLEKRRGVTYISPVLVHPTYSWAVASLDGLCDRHTLEIKTMSLEKHLDVRDLGEIPDYYDLQMQWGLLIARAMRLPAKVGLFASYRPEDGSLYEMWVKPDMAVWASMEAAAHEFMGWVVRDEEPPDMCTVEL